MSSAVDDFVNRRKELGLTQQGLGDAVGVTTRTVQSWESGEHVPRLNPVRMLRLCQVLKLSIEELAAYFQPDEIGPPSGQLRKAPDEAP